MSDDTHATLRASVEKFTSMIRETALDGDTEHGDLYLNILEDEVRILQAAPGETVLTYGSYGEDYFDDIDLEREVRTLTGKRGGDEYEYDVGCEAIINVADVLTYLGFASDGGTVELQFTGSEDRRLATYFRAEGALEAWVKLPGSQSALDGVPHWLAVNRWTQDNVYTDASGEKELPVRIETNADKVKTIIKAVKDDKDADFYPIVIEDDEFVIDVGDEQRSGVRGSLGAREVENKTDSDVENAYFDGFEEIFNVLSGPVTLQTAPGNAPLAVVQSDDRDRVVRHVNGPVNQS